MHLGFFCAGGGRCGLGARAGGAAAAGGGAGGAEGRGALAAAFDSPAIRRFAPKRLLQEVAGRVAGVGVQRQRRAGVASAERQVGSARCSGHLGRDLSVFPGEVEANG